MLANVARNTNERKSFFMDRSPVGLRVRYATTRAPNSCTPAAQSVRSEHPKISYLCCIKLRNILRESTQVHQSSTSKSSPSTLTGNTLTCARSGGSAIPVVTSNAHECQGQTTAFPSIHPPPSGPSRCGQTLSRAHSFPSTLAKQIALPRASPSITSPTLGASQVPHNRTHSATSHLSFVFAFS